MIFLGFQIWNADIKGAYLQSSPIKRAIYVKPPRDWIRIGKCKRIELWKLLKIPYGIVEAGRQWMICIEDWMLTKGRLERLLGISKMFTRCNEKGKKILLVPKRTNDFVVAGTTKDIRQFMNAMGQKFVIGKICKGPRHKFGGCNIVVESNGDIKSSMNEYWKGAMTIAMNKCRKRMRDSKASAKEIIQYRSLAGTLLYLGNETLAQASYSVSLMQLRLGYFKLQHLIDANIMVGYLKKLNPVITYRQVHNVIEAALFKYSDASHPKDRDYGQTGILIGIVGFK